MDNSTIPGPNKSFINDELRVTHVLSEVKTMTWEIHDFLTIMALGPLPNASMEFEAGHGIFAQPTKWRMEIVKYLPLAQPEHYTLVLELLAHPGTEIGNVHAKYLVKIKNRDEPGTLIKESAKPSNFTNYIKILFVMSLSSENIRKCLVNDALTVEIKLVLFGKVLVNSGDGPSLVSCRKRKMVEQARKEICLNLGTLLDSGFNSDFMIKVRKLDSDEFAELKVHKNILGARSDVLKAMLETPMQEQATGTMTIQDLSEDCVNLVMKWIYSGSLDDDWKKVPEEMIRAADKYHLTLLLDYLNHNLHLACELDNALTLLNVAKLHGLAEGIKNVSEFIKANFDKVLEDLVQGNNVI